MQLTYVKIRNFRALQETPPIKLSRMAVIVGRNDAGKSSVLHSISLFFGESSLEASDLHRGMGPDETVEVEVGFKLDNTQQLQSKNLISSDGDLKVKKIYGTDLKLRTTQVNANDFADLDFQNLWSKKERELNEICRKHDLTVTQSGRSITNADKIGLLVDYARTNQIPTTDVWIEPDKEVLDEVEGSYPEFLIFPSELRLVTDQSEFQSPFQKLITDAIEADTTVKNAVDTDVQRAIAQSIKSIESNLRDQSDSITQLIPTFELQWKKLVSLRIETEDRFGVRVPLSSRGLGVRRLLMVAFLKYMAERSGVERSRIYVIEEPETYLHPKAQRDLISSFKKLKDIGNQIVITSHSPVFAAEAQPEDIILVTRESARAAIVQGEEVRPESIVEELGILPRDMLAGYSACAFVEGPADAFFFKTASRTLRDAGKVSEDLTESKIGLIPVGGNNLRFFVEKELVLKRLNRRFAVIKDSEKRNVGDNISAKVIAWKGKCEGEGGRFFILRKRMIENYLHPAAVQRALLRNVAIEDFNDVKPLISTGYDWNRHLKPVIESMTAEEILERDAYPDGTSTKHEIQQIITEILGMV